MSAPARSQRVRLALIMALVAAAALGSFWILEVIRQGSGDDARAIPKDEPDYTVEKFNFVRMSKTGEARYNVSGTKLTHFPNDDTFEIQQPLLHNLADVEAPLRLRAERAVVDNTGRKIHLYDNVQAERPASPESVAFRMNTAYLLLLPDDDILKTDKAVDILHGHTQLTGVGLMANSVTREFHIYSKAHGVIAAPTP